ncbi:hypothetical protein ACTFIZ_010044 [Dictyostelium cf. discoideum]
MNINLLNFFIFLLFCFVLINFCNCQLLKITDISNPNNHKMYPQYSDKEFCNFSFEILCLVEPPIDDQLVFSTQTNFSTFLIINADKAGSIFRVTHNGLSFGSYSSNIVSYLSNNPTIKIDINISYSCEMIDYELMEVEFLKPNYFKKNEFYGNGVIQLFGLKYPLNNLVIIGGSAYPLNPNYFIISLYELDGGIVENYNVSLLFYGPHTINITIPSSTYLDYNLDISNSKINHYPNETTNVSEFGLGCSTVYSVTINKTSDDYEPYLYVYDGYSKNPDFTPIYQNENFITYLGQLYLITPEVKYSFFSKNFEKIYETQTINLKVFSHPDIINSFLSSGEGVSLIFTSLFFISFGTETQYGFYPLVMNWNGYKNSYQWPYGFTSGNNFKYEHGQSHLQYLYSYYFSNIFIILNSGNFVTVTSSYAQVLNSSVLPTLLEYECNLLFDESYFFRFKVNTNGFGGSIYLGSDIALRYESVVNSESNNSVLEFETVVDLYKYTITTITIENLLSNRIEYKLGDYYSISPLLKTEIPFGNINPLLITNISFLYNNIDVTNKSVNNIIYFNYEGEFDKDRPFALLLNDPVSILKNGDSDSSDLRFSKWNSTISMYQIEFTVPANTQSGHIPFTLYVNPNSNYNSIDSTILPLSAQLFIISSNFDGYGPIFNKIEKMNTTNEFGWKFIINDQINGFDYGDIIVRGEMDSSTYKFHLTPSNLTRGDKFNGEYQININISNLCASQNYIITDVNLFDTQGNFAKFSVSEQCESIRNPFINYLGDSTINKLFKKCTTENDGYDISPPELTWFNAVKTIKNNSQTIITFDFQATDLDTGLKNEQFPIVYIESTELQFIQCESKIKYKTSKTGNYTCEIELPVGFGYNSDIVFSVYGFINNGGYYSGFSSTSLSALPYLPIFSMSNIQFVRKIEILRTSQIYSTGGKLWIVGRGYNSSIQYVQIKYSTDSEFTQNSIPNKTSSTALLILDIKPTDKPFIIRLVSNNAQQSNEFIVTPLSSILFVPPLYTPTPTTTITQSPTPTNKPQTCLGDPICGGEKQGLCSSNGCVCYPPWIGNDCNSQVVIIPQPSTNTFQPSTEIPIIDNSNNNQPSGINYLYKSLISIVSIRELDFNGNQINSYPFDQWIFTEIRQNKSQYFTSIKNNPISSTITPLITNITVILEWFKDSTTIEFANNNITMYPSSIKYTIEISEYKFSNQLNNLQLVMSASFESSKTNDICSLKDFGETSNGDNSNYFKIQIDDHSLYGRFIKRAIIDSKISTIENVLLDSKMNSIQTASSSQSFIGITIPNYQKSITIDPDFSVLLDSKSTSKNDENSICTSNQPKLTTPQLVGIIIGSIAFATVIAISITYHVIKKERDSKFKNGLQNKLNTFKS